VITITNWSEIAACVECETQATVDSKGDLKLPLIDVRGGMAPAYVNAGVWGVYPVISSTAPLLVRLPIISVGVTFVLYNPGVLSSTFSKPFS
jgi:hypothetical protein